MPQDSHQGGDLFDMAKDGTSMPNDAGKMNLIPSVPRPDQMDNTLPNAANTELAGVADNATDISRGFADQGMTGEVETGTGDVLPGAVEAKRLHHTANNPAAKGHPRDDKHSSAHSSKNNEFEQGVAAGEGGAVDLDASEEDRVQKEGISDETAAAVEADRDTKV